MDKEIIAEFSQIFRKTDFLLLRSSYIRDSSDRLFEHICYTHLCLPSSVLSVPSTPLYTYTPRTWMHYTQAQWLLTDMQSEVSLFIDSCPVIPLHTHMHGCKRTCTSWFSACVLAAGEPRGTTAPPITGLCLCKRNRSLSPAVWCLRPWWSKAGQAIHTLNTLALLSASSGRAQGTGQRALMSRSQKPWVRSHTVC